VIKYVPEYSIVDKADEKNIMEHMF